MSNDSLGFKAGRPTGWQTEKWPSGSGGSGNGGTGGGFRDHSDDEDTNRRTPPEDEFHDDDFDSGFGKKATSPTSAGGSSGFRDSAASEPKSATISATFAKPISGPRVKKPIDLGAAAAFAAQKKQQPLASEAPQHNYNPIVADLFAADDITSSHVISSHVASNLSFDDADDFDPRESANANGSFGDFSAAFTSGEHQLPPAKIESQDDGDDFADFSSAFGGGFHHAAPSIPAVFSPTPAAAPASSAPMFDLFSDPPVAEKVSTVDLLSGLDMGGAGFGGPMSSAPTSNFGGLGGLNFSPPPPLIGAHSLQPQPNSGSLFDFDSQAHMGGPQLMPSSNNNNGNSSNAATTASNNFNKKPTTWDTVAGVNIDLDNLKLGGKSQKKPALPMNALMTPTSSPTKGFPNQPPQMMKPGGALSSNDLL